MIVKGEGVGIGDESSILRGGGDLGVYTRKVNIIKPNIYFIIIIDGIEEVRCSCVAEKENVAEADRDLPVYSPR